MQPLTFPQGFFDSTKLKAKDAIYWNLLALSALEHTGITVEELNALAKSRSEEPRLESHIMQKSASFNMSNSSHNDNHLLNISDSSNLHSIHSVSLPSTSSGIHETHTSSESSQIIPKNPFRRLHDLTDDSDEVDNPFDEIVTRAPSQTSSILSLQQPLIASNIQQQQQSLQTTNNNQHKATEQISKQQKALRYIIKRYRQLKAEWDNILSNTKTVEDIMETYEPNSSSNEEARIEYKPRISLILPPRVDP
ncbi:unnamed protein product [Thelazia callipaeda]|uniref:Ras-GEF domain-containing protein n=1 Tax=Thelazia callipaeda TaxID=103827 RepID=A0A0N5CU51_THECL|nr:unnamed protein product [Thelazia callipaeda]